MPADAAVYRDIRLAGLRCNPEAFGSTFEAENARPLSFFSKRLGGVRRVVAAPWNVRSCRYGDGSSTRELRFLQKLMPSTMRQRARKPCRAEFRQDRREMRAGSVCEFSQRRALCDCSPRLFSGSAVQRVR